MPVSSVRGPVAVEDSGCDGLVRWELVVLINDVSVSRSSCCSLSKLRYSNDMNH